MAKKTKQKKDPTADLDPESLERLRKQRTEAAVEELTKKAENEDRNTKINLLKIQNQWRKIMRLSKSEQLKCEVEILAQSHERDLDRRDAIIQSLDRDIEESEEQYQIALRSHMQQVENLISLHKERLNEQTICLKRDMLQQNEIFEKERDAVLTFHRCEVGDIQSVIRTIDDQDNEKQLLTSQSHEQQREEIRNKNSEEINVLRIGLDSVIEELEQQFEAAHLGYLQQTSQRTHDFKDLTKSDQHLSHEIETKKKQIDKQSTSLLHWRTKYKQLTRENEERNMLLTAEKASMHKHYQDLKNRIANFRNKQSKHILAMKKAVMQSEEKLKDSLNLAENLLKMGELNAELETEADLLTPFLVCAPSNYDTGPRLPADQPPQAVNPFSSAALYHPSDNIYNQEATSVIVPEEEILVNLLRRVGKIQVDAETLEMECQSLEAENEQLRNLQQHLANGTSMNKDTLSGPNPLMIVNGRSGISSAAMPVRRSDKILTQDVTCLPQARRGNIHA